MTKPRSLADALRELLAAAPDEVLAVYLYGSRARGDERTTSDVDLGLLLQAPPSAPALGNAARRVEDLVERALRLPVEAVILNRASPDLVHRVLRDGVVVLDRDRTQRLRLEVQARNDYFDLEPLRRLYRRQPA